MLETRRLSQDFRKVQNFAMSSTTYDCSGSAKAVPFGIILDTDVTDRYLIVADCDNNKIYNAGSDPIISTVVFNSVKLDLLNPKKAGSNTLEVFFVPPLPSTAINEDESNTASATIRLKSLRDNSLKLIIFINSKGVINAQQ